MDKLPQFNSKDLCRALNKLGFEPCSPGKHQYKYKHPTKHSAGRRPYFIFPYDVDKKPEFQKALIRELIRLWNFTLGEILNVLK